MENDYGTTLEGISQRSEGELAQLLISIAFELTIRARGTYSAGSNNVEAPEQLRAFNECQHFLSGVLRRLLAREEVDRDALVGSLKTLSQNPLVGGSVGSAVKISLRALPSL